MTIKVKENADLHIVQPEGENEKVAGGEHGEIGSILIGYLFNYVYPQKLGRLFDGQTSFDMPGFVTPRQPDVAFVKVGRLPSRVRGNVPLAPDLAVEIVSPSDTLSEVADKVHQYQQAGVSLIWVVDPYDQAIFVHRANERKFLTLTVDDEIDGAEVLPGFKLPVKALFE